MLFSYVHAFRGIRIVFWTIAILLGGAQTWYTRHRIFSDGISYLEIARQYANGDWHGALNAYWSPLYSWAIAAYLVVLRPSPYWETAAMHAINFGAFLGSCWIFEKFLLELGRTRPAGMAGFSNRTLIIVGYAAVIHGGLLMVGIGYVSPDMIAFFLTGLAAWLILRIANGGPPIPLFAGLGATLGLGFLARTAFAPLSVVYGLAAAVLLVKKRGEAIRLTVLFGVCFAAVAAPFVIGLSEKRGAFTMGESGKLNYGWEVDGAARSTHWQGEPGDIGKPVHPTRLIAGLPVPVYEFAEPVSGSYPPWHDPSYWYEGIAPHLKIGEQVRVLWLNMRATAFYLATEPAFLVFGLALVLSRRLKWPAVYWVLMLPCVAGIAMYCLVYVDKRYIAGYFVVLWITAAAGVAIPEGRLRAYADAGAQTLSLLVVLAIAVWLRPAMAMAVSDAMNRREGEYNASWMLAHRFAELGLKPGDRIAFVGESISADWVRLAGAKIVIEVPLRYLREANITNGPLPVSDYPRRFFDLDEASRERVYEAFRKAGAVMAVANTKPDAQAGDWQRVLDPAEAGYPNSKGQTSLQVPGYYRWLNR